MDITEPVRRFWGDVWSEGRVEVLDEIIAPGATENGEPLEVAGFKDGVTRWREIFDGFEARIEEILVVDDRVITRVTYRGTHVESWGPLPPSGASPESIGIDLFRVRDGRIVELWHAVDHLPLVKAIGGRVVPAVGHTP